MDSLGSLTGFLGWCSVINLGLLVVASLVWVANYHSLKISAWAGLLPMAA